MKFLLLLFLLSVAVIPLWSNPNADSLVYSFTNFQDSTKRDLTLSSDIDTKVEPGKVLLARGELKNLSPGAIMKLQRSI